MVTLLNGIWVVTGLGLAAAVILVVFSKIMAVKENPMVHAVREALPGVNCGACGYAGCDDYAAAVANGECSINLCIPGGDACAQELGGITGQEAGEVVKRVALVACQGNYENTWDKMNYKGIKTCAAADRFFSGVSVCPDGCMGFGDCVASCKYGAIKTNFGVAVIDRELCTGCGACVDECPKGLISTVRRRRPSAFVLCKNHEKGGITRKGCNIGCIGCQKCVKICPTDAIAMDRNLAVVDRHKCINCLKCVKECPTNAITSILQVRKNRNISAQ